MATCAGIAALAGAATIIAKIVDKFKKPNTDQNARLDEHESRLNIHEERLNKHDGMFAKDRYRMGGYDEGNKVTQKALLALLSHAIDGNNTVQLTEAKTSLENYLIEGGNKNEVK